MLRGVKFVGEAWEIKYHIWGPFTYEIFAFSAWVLFFLNCLRILLNCAFYAFYKGNQGLEVPRETRLEKLMRLLEVSKKKHGGKAELSTKTILGGHFGPKSHMDKDQGSCSGVWIWTFRWELPRGVIITTCRISNSKLDFTFVR